MTIFFSVDVETSDTNPWKGGQLLSVGIVPVFWEPGEPAKKCWENPGWYQRIDCSRILKPLGWYTGVPEDKQTATYKWWIQQNDEAQDEAWRDTTLERVLLPEAAQDCVDYLDSLEPDPSKRIFVANPVAFDKMWMDYFFSGIDHEPFSHRSLCLRSFRFGIERGSEWGASRPHHEPTIPHHAYFDADAQAQDLIDLLSARDRIEDVLL